MSTTVTLDEREVAVILAALRYWQSIPSDAHVPLDLMEIWTDGGKLTPLDDGGVEELCERINCGDPEFEEVDLKEAATLKKGEYLIEYGVDEEVSYGRQMKIDGAVLVSLEELEELVENDWVENGDANKDMVCVEERYYSGIRITDRSGKCLSAELFFASR